MLYSCYDLLRPDVVTELSWQHGLNDFYMPYKIQSQRSMTEKIKKLEAEVKEHGKKVAVKEEAEAEAPIINPGFGNKLLLTQGGLGSVYPNGNGVLHASMPGYSVF